MKKCLIKYLKKVQSLQVKTVGKGGFYIQIYKFDSDGLVDYLIDTTISSGTYDRFSFYSWQIESQYKEEFNRLCEFLKEIGWLS